MKGGIPLTQLEEKQVLCNRHRALLQVLLKFGSSGVMLLPQLRALCLAWDLYPSAQAVNRAVRELRAAEILTRQTWVDNNSDLLLARKFVWRFFSGRDSQEVATPRRPATMAPYILQARKIDWLLSLIERKQLATMEAAETCLRRHGCTLFLRLSDLPDYYRNYAPYLSAERPEDYREQLARLDADQISALALRQPGESPPPPLVTLAQAHRRGIYILNISPSRRAVTLALFAGRRTRAARVMDWLIDVQAWVNSLLPYYACTLVVYALDDAHRTALRAALTAPAPGRKITPYWRERLIQRHLGRPEGHRAVRGPRVPEQCHPDTDGEPHHEQPPQGPQDRPEQERADRRRLRQRQDQVLAQAQPFTVP